MGETRVVLKKMRDIKGTFHAKMGLIKDRCSICVFEFWKDISKEVIQIYTLIKNLRVTDSPYLFK